VDRLPVAQREVQVAAWLAGAGVPVAAPVVAEPVVVEGRVVTFWQEVPDPRPSTPAELAGALRQLHRLSPPPELGLPVVEPLHRVRERLSCAVGLDAADRVFLQGLADELGRRWAGLVFELPAGVVHGDAHVDNLVRGSDGRLAFVDLEEFAVGPPEWDLVLTAIERDCGWVGGGEYAQFCRVYGYDVTSSPAYEVVRAIRLVRMTSWLAQKAGESPQIAAQVRHRVATLRDGSSLAGWRAY
jgi:aminoglycoside phosphotransferase (APT) family kinase protein